MKFVVAFAVLCVVAVARANVISQPSVFNLQAINPFPSVTAFNPSNLNLHPAIQKREVAAAEVAPEPASVETTQEEIVTEAAPVEDTQPEEPPVEAETQSTNDAPKFYEITLTIEHPWSIDLTVKNSPKFSELAKQLDQELTSLVDNTSSKTAMPLGSFQLINALPSTLDGHLFVVLILQPQPDFSAEEIFEIIEIRALTNSRIYEIGLKLLGMSLSEVTMADLQQYSAHVECENSGVCRLTAQGVEETTQSASPNEIRVEETLAAAPNSPPADSCNPHDTIHRGSTSIYIFEDQKCVDKLKDGIVTRSCEAKAESNASESDEMDTAASSQHEQLVTANDEKETVVVIRKKGSRVWVEL